MPSCVEQDRAFQIRSQRIAVLAHDAKEVEQIVRVEIENGEISFVHVGFVFGQVPSRADYRQSDVGERHRLEPSDLAVIVG